MTSPHDDSQAAQEASQAARDLIAREADHHNVTGLECTCMRLKLNHRDAVDAKLMRELARIRHVADRRNGLRPSGRLRNPVPFVSRGGAA